MNEVLDIGRVVGGRWRIDRFIASGGFGRVYAATDVSSAAIGSVAVKVLLAGASTAERQAFLAEVRHMAALRHPNLVTHVDSGLLEHDEQGAVFLVTELCHESLADYTERRADGRFPADQVPTLVAGMSAGLAHLHDSGRVHRDLKPANILRLGDAWKLADFGLVRDLSASGVYHLNTLAGTPRFMAPEFFHGGHIGPATDVWSLGVVLHEVVAGIGVHEGEGAAFIHNLTSTSPAISESLPPNVAGLIRRCLAEDPAQRPTAASLPAILAGQPVPIPPPSRPATPPHTPAPTDRRITAEPVTGAPGSATEAAGPGGRRRLVFGSAIAGVALIAAGLAAAFVLGDDGDGAEPGPSSPVLASQTEQLDEIESGADAAGGGAAGETDDAAAGSGDADDGAPADGDPGEAAPSDGGGEPGERIPFDEFEVGDCVDPELGAERFVIELRRDCNAPHFYEVLAVFEHPDAGGDFPGDDALATFGGLQCSRAFETRFGIDHGDTAIQVGPFRPSEDDWADNIFVVVCTMSRNNTEPLTEPIGDDVTKWIWKSGDSLSLLELQQNRCFDEGNELVELGITQRVVFRECDEPHIGEFYWSLFVDDLEGDPPTEAALTQAASARCHDILHEDYGATHHRLGFDSTSVAPTPQEWERFGARVALCYVIFDEPVTDSLSVMAESADG